MYIIYMNVRIGLINQTVKYLCNKHKYLLQKVSLQPQKLMLAEFLSNTYIFMLSDNFAIS